MMFMGQTCGSTVNWLPSYSLFWLKTFLLLGIYLNPFLLLNHWGCTNEDDHRCDTFLLFVILTLHPVGGVVGCGYND